MHIWYRFKQLFVLYVWKKIPWGCSIGTVRASIATQFMAKVKKMKRKKSHFRKYTIVYQSTFSSRTSNNRKTKAPNRYFALLSYIRFPNFYKRFSQHLLKISVSVWTLTHYTCKHFFDNEQKRKTPAPNWRNFLDPRMRMIQGRRQHGMLQPSNTIRMGRKYYGLAGIWTYKVTWSANVTLIKFYAQWLFHLPRTSTPSPCCHQLIETTRYKSTDVASQIPRYAAHRAHLGCLWSPGAQKTQVFQQFAAASDRAKWGDNT